MISDKEFEKTLKPILNIYSEVESELLYLIASKFSDYTEVGGSLEWWIAKLDEMGLLNEEAMLIISLASDKSIEQVKRAIEKVGYSSVDWATYNRAYNLGVTTINPQNISLVNVIESQIDESIKQIQLIRTSALEGTNKAYRQLLDKAYLETSTGLYDYNTSIKKAVEQLAKKGITAATYIRKDGTEVKYSIESVARRNIMSELNNTANKSNEHVANELEAEYVAVSEHMGARNKGEGHVNHEDWQGDYYNRINGEFQRITGYGLVDGLGGVNCRHIHWAYYPGISPPIKKEIDSKENDRIYNLEQKQRYLERQVRESKRELAAAQGLKDEEYIKESRKRLRERQFKLKSFVDSNPELSRDYSREKISDVNLNYLDVTQQWLDQIDYSKVGRVIENDYFNYNGQILRHGVDGVKLTMDLDDNEIGIANWLKETFHEDVQLIPRPSVNGQGIKSSDYIFKNENWDLKSIEGNSADTIRNRIRKGQGQSNNFIVDITSKSSMSVDDSIMYTKKLFSQNNTKFVETVILKKNQELISVFRKKK